MGGYSFSCSLVFRLEMNAKQDCDKLLKAYMRILS